MDNIINKNIKLFRDSFGFTQEKVASFIGIDRGAYANYESGRDIPYHILQKLCNLYGVSLSSLYEEDEKKIQDELICCFRTDTLCDNDLIEISDFKKIVRNYLKIAD